MEKRREETLGTMRGAPLSDGNEWLSFSGTCYVQHRTMCCLRVACNPHLDHEGLGSIPLPGFTDLHTEIQE